MPKKFAVVVGINQYEYEHPLNYAERDAVAMETLLTELEFNEIYRYSDQSPAIRKQSTRPTRTNLLRVINRISTGFQLQPDDSFWFFFSGHGVRHQGQDYLLPCDGDPENIQQTTIPTQDVIYQLRGCGAGHLVLILDACRNLSSQVGGDGSKGLGNQTVELAKQNGVITIFSCHPGERSYELADKEQGAFTHVLLEALRGECHPTRTTVQQLDDYLRQRVQALQPHQTPWIVPEPGYRYHQILLPESTSVPPPASTTPKTIGVKGAKAPNPNVESLKHEAILALAAGDWTKALLLWREIAETANKPNDIRLAYKVIETLNRHSLHPSPPLSQAQISRTLYPTSLESSESSDLWQKILSNISLPSTRALMQQMAHLISFNGHQARIGLDPRVYKRRLANLAKDITVLETTLEKIGYPSVKVSIESAVKDPK